jgi:hypothetical protein
VSALACRPPRLAADLRTGLGYCSGARSLICCCLCRIEHLCNALAFSGEQPRIWLAVSLTETDVLDQALALETREQL